MLRCLGMCKSKMTDVINVWDDTDSKGVHVKCEYNIETRQYSVTVEYKHTRYSETFHAMFEPRFGPDTADMATATQIAEKLADKIDKEFNL